MLRQVRRHDLHPWTLEVLVTVVLVIMLVVVCWVHLGCAIANVLAGADWTYPGLIELFRSLPGVLRGDAGAGLATLNVHTSSPVTLWVCVVVRS
jgi:hypothetical protein